MIENSSIWLGVISSIISIIGFILSIFKHEKILTRILFFLVLIFSTSTVIVAYKYKNKVDEIVDLNLRKDRAKKEAIELLNKLPSYASSFEPGKSQGIVYAGLTFLENHQSLFPETYKVYKTQIVEKLKKVNSENYSEEYNTQLEIAGETALTIIKSIAEHNNTY